MRNQLETFKTLFEQVRGLGIVMQLPNDSHFKFSDSIQVYFADNYDTTSISFGKRYSDQVEICKSSFTKYASPSLVHLTTIVIISTPDFTASLNASLYSGSITDG